MGQEEGNKAECLQIKQMKNNQMSTRERRLPQNTEQPKETQNEMKR